MVTSGGRHDTTYLFIDGGHLRKYYLESVRRWFGCDGEIVFAEVKRTYSAQKSFYYDCLDDIRREAESDADFNSRIERQETFFNKIREVVGSHVRLGSLTGTAKNKRQKEVDILLAVDMLNHAVRQNMSRAILLAGDRDFKPVVESLVQMGIFVEVAGDRKHTSKDLAWAADNYREISFGQYHAWSDQTLRNKFPIGITQINLQPPETAIIQGGTLDGKYVKLSKWPDKNIYYITVEGFYNSGESLTLQYHEAEKLRLYFELQYGNVKWE